jgi:hypothetical protein
MWCDDNNSCGVAILKANELISNLNGFIRFNIVNILNQAIFVVCTVHPIMNYLKDQ